MELTVFETSTEYVPALESWALTMVKEDAVAPATLVPLKRH